MSEDMAIPPDRSLVLVRRCEVLTIEEVEEALYELAVYSESQAQRQFAEAVVAAERSGEYYEGAARYKELTAAIVTERHKIYIEGVYALMQRIEEDAKPTAWQAMTIGAIACLMGLAIAVAILGWLAWMQNR